MILLIGGAAGGILVFSKMREYRAQRIDLERELKKHVASLSQARKKLVEQANDLRIMLVNRIPGITELALNKPVALSNRYAKSITFSEAGVGIAKVLEYHITLENLTDAPLKPYVDIFLFDNRGLQLGHASVRSKSASSPNAGSALKAGEVRSYTGKLDIDRKGKATYFLVEAG